MKSYSIIRSTHVTHARFIFNRLNGEESIYTLVSVLKNVTFQT